MAPRLFGAVTLLADLVLLPTGSPTDDLVALPAMPGLVEDAGRPFVSAAPRVVAGQVAAPRRHAAGAGAAGEGGSGAARPL